MMTCSTASSDAKLNGNSKGDDNIEWDSNSIAWFFFFFFSIKGLSMNLVSLLPQDMYWFLCPINYWSLPSLIGKTHYLKTLIILY